MADIILCFDGTCKRPGEHGDISEQTNVFTLAQMLENSSDQIVYYDEGVGAEWYNKILAGISGAGISTNIKQGYEFLLKTWTPGSRVFLFGFSRGAYTARSLAGMLYSCGIRTGRIVNTELEAEHAFDIYKKAEKEDRKKFKSSNTACPVEVLGVWDTVGALGIPVSFLKGINSKLNQFHDTKLNKEVKYTYQALALDEQREAFIPTLWDEAEVNESQTIEQV